MTIASFTKPVVLGVALLGAVSASLAIDSAGDGGKGPSTAQAIDLTAANTVQITANVTGEDEAAVEVTVGKDVAEEKQEPNKQVANKKVQNKITKQEWAFAEKKDEKGVLVLERRVAPTRTAQPVQMRVPQPLMPADMVYSPPQPSPYYAPPTIYPLAQPLDIQLGGLNFEANIKLRTHETKVAELQLESKMLEIRAFDVKGEEKEALLEESRKKSLMAEAEQLRMQVERRREEIKQLEKAMKEQAEGIKKQAAQQAEQAKTIVFEQAAKHAEDGIAIAKRAAEQGTFAAVAHSAAAAEEAAKEVTTSQIAAAVKQAEVAVDAHQAANWRVKGRNYESVQFRTKHDGALSLQPGDRVFIRAIGVDPEESIEDVYIVEPMGTIALGVNYGRVKVMGKSVIDAEVEVLKNLKKEHPDAKIQITYYGSQDEETNKVPQQPGPFDPNENNNDNPFPGF